MNQDDRGADPLKAEAEKREEWRGDGTQLDQGDAPRHTLPASESEGAGADDNEGATSRMRTISPPD